MNCTKNYSLVFFLLAVQHLSLEVILHTNIMPESHIYNLGMGGGIIFKYL